mmetsp:Transcript_16567/g.52857  ORF Transcript_16567/g.52857 Transcript_16567/m.52857 type:complete len:258 (+) Transcript_16567:254-1027(+)
MRSQRCGLRRRTRLPRCRDRATQSTPRARCQPVHCTRRPRRGRSHARAAACSCARRHAQHARAWVQRLQPRPTTPDPSVRGQRQGACATARSAAGHHERGRRLRGARTGLGAAAAIGGGRGRAPGRRRGLGRSRAARLRARSRTRRRARQRQSAWGGALLERRQRAWARHGGLHPERLGCASERRAGLLAGQRGQQRVGALTLRPWQERSQRRVGAGSGGGGGGSRHCRGALDTSADAEARPISTRTSAPHSARAER